MKCFPDAWLARPEANLELSATVMLAFLTRAGRIMEHDGYDYSIPE
jgi:hypothetical protein